jgi:predicted RNA-binding Zn-ribbon protein involved in translation (DUF1610 family)
LSDQKYRQHGYLDRERDSQTRDNHTQDGRPKPRPREETFGPRAMKMPGTRTVSRCTQCGVVLRGADGSGACPQCGFDLHSCKQCAHFDPGERNECRRPIAERISPKDKRNTCTFYAIKTAVERETSTSTGYASPSVSSPAPSAAQDARRAFENLFKK